MSQHARAIVVLVEEPAGLLSTAQRHLEARAVLLDDHPFRHAAMCGFRVQRQPLQFAHARVVAQQDGGRLDDLLQRRHDVGLQALHACGGKLRHQRFAVAVHHQPRQAVGLTERQPVERLRIQPFPQRQGDVQPMHQQ